MENVCEYSPRLRSGSEACWGATNYYSGRDAIFCGYSRPVWLCLKHAKRKKMETQKTCCFPAERKCKEGKNLVPCPERILSVATQLDNYKGGTFLCQKHLRLVDLDPRFTSHKLYAPPGTRKVSVFLQMKF